MTNNLAPEPMEANSEILEPADKTENAPRKEKNVYMLAVAINDYPVPHHKLKGCVNDATAMVEYVYTLYNNENTAVSIKRLFNEEATHEAVSSAFLEHLGKAQGKDDVALFYFCGHGSQEPCPPEFLHEEVETKHNQGIVCHDSRDPDRPGGFDLADKEMRYLIWKLEQKTQANVVVIMDCCHSGGGTREIDDPVKAPVLTRKIESSVKTRPIDTFNFFGDPDFESWRSKDGKFITLPKGRHVQMAAAHSTQTAKETVCDGTPHGIFTHSLLSILKESGSGFTYTDLKNRLKNRIANKVKDQTPEIAAVVDDTLVDTVFLGTAQMNRKNVYTCSNNGKVWTVDAGSAYGIPAKSPNVLFGLYKTPDDLAKNNMAGMAKVKAVRPDICAVIMQDIEPDPEVEYYARLVFMDKPKIPIYLDRDPADAAAGDALMAEYQSRVAASQDQEKWAAEEAVEFLEFELTEEPGSAEYRLVIENARFYLKRFEITKPLVKSVGSAAEAIDMMAHVAKWVNNKELNNPTSMLPEDAISVELTHCVMQDDGFGDAELGTLPDKLDAKEPVINLEYRADEESGEMMPPHLSIKVLKNPTYTEALYFCVLKFDPRFGTHYVSYDSTDSTAKSLVLPEGPDGRQHAKDEDVCLEVADILWDSGITELMTTFKIIYSNMPIEPGPYLQKSLELPDDEDMGQATRAALKPLRPKPDWRSMDIHINCIRPK